MVLFPVFSLPGSVKVLSERSNRGQIDMTHQWYVLRSKPRKEGALCRYARSQGHEIFYPTIPVKPVNPRAAKIRSYFPGYMFLKTDMEAVGVSTFHWMPFSQGLVRVGMEPARVPENIIQALRRKVQQIREVGGLQFDGLEKGDRIMIRDGTFEGYQALFDIRLPGTERVRVLLEMLNDRLVPVEMDSSLIEKYKH
jgi:transcription antitermination factor NusG